MDFRKANALIFACLAHCLLCPIELLAGSEIGNGDGLAEHNVLVAYAQVGGFMRMCVESAGCRLSEDQALLMRRISASLDDEFRSKEQIRFLSEKQNPGFFVIDGYPKIAKTGSSIGDPIFFNLDMIYAKSCTGDIETIDIPGAAAILVHEFGHHQGEKDESKLDLFGARLESFLRQRVQTVDLGRGIGRTVEAITIGDEGTTSFSQILIQDSYSVHDLSPQLHSMIHCPCAGQALSGFEIRNLHWNDKLLSELQYIIDSIDLVPGLHYRFPGQTNIAGWLGIYCSVPDALDPVSYYSSFTMALDYELLSVPVPTDPRASAKSIVFSGTAGDFRLSDGYQCRN